MRRELVLGAVWTVAACAGVDAAPFEPDAGHVAEDDAGSYAWQLPTGFLRPAVPADNPMSAEKVELGRHLFYENALSLDGTASCSTCHVQSLAFTDGKAQPTGVTGQLHPRSAQSLVNVGYASMLTWENDLLDTLEVQGRVPLFGDEPVELGMRGKEAELVERLRKNAFYPDAFAAEFPEETEPVSVATILKAISAFERTIVSGDSPYDRWHRGEANAVSDAVKHGSDLFFSERFECFHCHGGFAFTDAVTRAGSAFVEKPMHVNALYNIDGNGAYPAPSRGLVDVSLRPEDMGRFKAPTLRNVAVTAPYMHDGTIATLAEVVEHYARGGRKIETGPNAGDGARSPLRSEFVRGFSATADEKADLVSFLESLTDPTLLTDPRFSDPNDP